MAARQEREIDARILQAWAQSVEDTLLARFPRAPISLGQAIIRRVRDVSRLQELHRAIVVAPDQAGVEGLPQQE